MSRATPGTARPAANDLPPAGLTIYTTDGAFYIYANVARLTNDSLDFCPPHAQRDRRRARHPRHRFRSGARPPFHAFLLQWCDRRHGGSARRLKAWQK